MESGRHLDIKINPRSVPLLPPFIMRCAIRLFSLLLLLGAVVWWGGAGARFGWWQTRVGIERTDETTGLSFIEWQERFVPGVETLGLGLLVGGALFVSTFLFRRRLPSQQNTT